MIIHRGWALEMLPRQTSKRVAFVDLGYNSKLLHRRWEVSIGKEPRPVNFGRKGKGIPVLSRPDESLDSVVCLMDFINLTLVHGVVITHVNQDYFMLFNDHLQGDPITEGYGDRM